MTAPACIHYADGLHRWRFEVGRWSGQPAYRCPCGAAAITWGEDDDAEYLAGLGGIVEEVTA